MLNLLEGVVNGGTSIRLRLTYELKGQIAGKTGTTNNQSDGWFMGIIPKLVAGVWTGGEERSIHFDGISLGQGANMALPVYGLFLQKVLADPNLDYSIEDEFEKPKNFHMNLNCGEDVEQSDTEKDPIDEEFFN